MRWRHAVLLALAMLVVLTAAGCSMLDRGVEHVGEWRETRVEKNERGWRAPDGGLYVCGKPVVDVQLKGRTCALELAPTVKDCLNDFGTWYHFRDEDGLSGISRQPLFSVCQDAEAGQHFKDADGIIVAGEQVVLDAGNGARD